MKSKKLIGILALGMSCASTMVMAAAETGDREFTLSGTGTSDSGFDTTAYSLDASIGWFNSKQFEMGLRQNVGFSDTEAGGTNFSGGTRLFFDYHFDRDHWQPFLGLSFGAVYGDSVKEAFSAGPEGGVKYYVKPKTFILVSASYQFNVRESAGDGTTFYTTGLGFNF